jgi:hypothetical protein
LRVLARNRVAHVCGGRGAGQPFFAADFDGEALADGDLDDESDDAVEPGFADEDGLFVDEPAPEPPLLAAVTDATASFAAFSAALARSPASGVFSPARPAPL